VIDRRRIGDGTGWIVQDRWQNQEGEMFGCLLSYGYEAVAGAILKDGERCGSVGHGINSWEMTSGFIPPISASATIEYTVETVRSGHFPLPIIKSRSLSD